MTIDSSDEDVHDDGVAADVEHERGFLHPSTQASRL